MKSHPCFLLLAGFLVAFAGCQSSAPAPPATPQATPVASAKPPPASDSKKEAIGSLYNDIQNGPLAKYMRGDSEESMQISPAELTEVRQVECMCVPTGEFNVSSDGNKLLMETWCAERNPVKSIIIVHVPDIIATRIPDKLIFRVRFHETVVSVEDLDSGKREVRLHYRDDKGVFHHIDLPPRQGKAYAYSFAELSPDTVVPIGEPRVVEVRPKQ